jgi:hypothetical protein
MPYTAPTTVTPGVPIASALHNLLGTDIVDHESRIGTVTTTMSSVPYANLASSAKNYTIVNYADARDVVSSDANNKILVSGAMPCAIYGASDVLVEGQTVNLFRGGTGFFSVSAPYFGTSINGTGNVYYLNPYGFAQLICIGKGLFILVGDYV